MFILKKSTDIVSIFFGNIYNFYSDKLRQYFQALCL